MSTRGDLYFVITQGTADIQVLEYIKTEFGFDKVILQSKVNKTSRYIVQDIKNSVLICKLFKRKYGLSYMLRSISTFLNAVNIKLKNEKYHIMIILF